MEEFEDFDESLPQMQNLIQLTHWSSFSTYQKYISFLMVVKNMNQRDVIKTMKEKHNIKLNPESLGNCLQRTALSLIWEPGMSGGKTPFLCPGDMDELETEIYERALHSAAFDTHTILDQAVIIKKKRLKQAIDVLKMHRCLQKAHEYTEKYRNVNIPAREWINNIMEKVNSHLVKPIFIEGKRYYDCTDKVLEEYVHNIRLVLLDIPEELIFTSDETMLDTTFKRKKIVPQELREYIEKEPEPLPHITSMCCTNVHGIHPPLFIILKNRKTLPKELQSLIITGQIWLASTPNGWMDRWSFNLWMLHIIPWISIFRSNMGPQYSRANCLLVLDGHASRTVSSAFKIAFTERIRVIIFLSHSSYVTQLFDVALASTLKKKFGDFLSCPESTGNVKMHV